MSQTSAAPLSQVQVQMPTPANDLRPQPLEAATLPGAGAYVSRSSGMPPDLFMSPVMVIDPHSAYKVSVSPDGASATVTLSTIGTMTVGTDGDTMESHFGSVVVEREYVLDLAAENPVVTDVHVTQTFSDSTELNGTDHLNASEPFPPLAPPSPPSVPPAPVPAPAQVPT